MSDKADIKKYTGYFWKAFFGFLGFVVLLLLLINWGVFGSMPSFEELENPKSFLATDVISEDGKILGKYYNENRSYAGLSELSPYLLSALIATEDVRFSEHSGIDFTSMATIPFYLLTGKKKGASTLTQQLAKNLFKRSGFLPLDKLREWIIAVKLERHYTKTEIITLYLNTVPFSDNAFGVKSAAHTFFGQTPDSLKVEEAAMLVGMLKGSTVYNPRRHPERALERRNTVLAQMVKYHYLDAAKYEKLKGEPIKLSYNKVDHNYGLAPYFREYLRQDLQRWCKENPKVDGSLYDIYKDGLKIYTTINSRMQQYAEEAVAKHLTHMQKIFSAQYRKTNPFKGHEKEFNQAYHGSDRYRTYKTAGMSEDSIETVFKRKIKMTVFSWAGGEIDTLMSPWDSIIYHRLFLQTGFCVMDPTTGHVKAWVGGISHRFFQLDHVNVNTKRQIGSTFKPLIYTIAIDNGWSPCYMVANEPVTFPSYGGWTPKNSDGKYGGSQSLKTGLARSTNCITAYLMKQIGPRPVVDLAARLGITSTVQPFPSICLGTPEISVIEMVGAYSAYANLGMVSKPIYITRIEDKYGNVIKQFVEQQTEALNDQTAYIMNKMLQGVVNEGTAMRLRRTYGFENEIAGKTGTTNDNTDAWFIGLTPKLIGGVWVGADDPFLRFFSLANGQGATAALPIWAYFFQKVYADKSLKISRDEHFPVPTSEATINWDCKGGGIHNSVKDDDYKGEE